MSDRLAEALAGELVILLCDLSPGVTLERARGDAGIALRHLREEGLLPAYPRRDGDVIVIGPECIATLDESVIAWRGRHYTAGLESLRERVAELGEGDVHGRYGQAIRDVLAEIDLLHEPA